MSKLHQTRPPFRERVIKKVGKAVKKHKKLYIPGVIVISFTIVLDECAKIFYKNPKKLLSIVCVLLCFVSSSSFSYPVLPLNAIFVSTQNASSVAISADRMPQASEPSQIAEVDAAVAVSSDLSEDEDYDEEQESGKVSEQDQYHLTDILGSENSDAITGQDSAATAISEQENFSADDWKLILINKQHPIPDDYVFPMSNIKGNMYCDKRILSSLLTMFKAAQRDGVNLVICSPYRSEVRQEKLFTRKIATYMNDGMAYMDAYTKAAQAVTIPGSSEHQVGLAIDIISDDYSYLDDGFGKTKAGEWLSENSSKFGFILRYPAGKENITGIEYEPWHFRYVGPDAADVIAKHKITLEEFWMEYIYN